MQAKKITIINNTAKHSTIRLNTTSVSLKIYGCDIYDNNVTDYGSFANISSGMYNTDNVVSALTFEKSSVGAEINVIGELYFDYNDVNSTNPVIVQKTIFTEVSKITIRISDSFNLSNDKIGTMRVKKVDLTEEISSFYQVLQSGNTTGWSAAEITTHKVADRDANNNSLQLANEFTLFVLKEPNSSEVYELKVMYGDKYSKYVSTTTLTDATQNIALEKVGYIVALYSYVSGGTVLLEDQIYYTNSKDNNNSIQAVWDVALPNVTIECDNLSATYGQEVVLKAVVSNYNEGFNYTYEWYSNKNVERIPENNLPTLTLKNVNDSGF